ncbi:hypothetical protein RJ640_003915 [Escallonia rubra]|uniref:Glycosyltransferase n=1 Tax=Escallonia rubra TaxID=112253 RepID=A0AA88SET0_9ASTE|nr:hypothetical protein RJ640_003915 [Escallonia rubra]
MAEEHKLHIVMFPWLAFGHMIPFLELSKLIAQKGHTVSFVSTPRNIDRLIPKLPPSLEPLIEMVKLPLPRISELPEKAESTMDIQTSDIQYLKKAFDGLQPELIRVLETRSPDWIIYDFAPYWLPPLAAQLGISCAFLSLVNAWFIAFLAPSAQDMLAGSGQRLKPEDFTVPPPWIPFSSKVAYRLHEINRIFGLASEDIASGVSDMYRTGKVLMGSDAIFIRHSVEFEPDWLNLLEELHQRPVIPIGFMPPLGEDSRDDENNSWLPISEWLGSHSKGSVVYVSLGSEVTLRQDELNELALGLELSGLPFFWVLREQSGLNDDSVKPPDGFVERTRGSGVVWTSWAPQIKILAHESVGGFLTHCGWSSIIEGLAFGRPLIMLPFMGDQGLNARVMVDKNVGIEVRRDESNGSFTRSCVADLQRWVMVEDGGRSCRDKAKEMKAIFGDEDSHKRHISNFIEYLGNQRLK